MSRLTLGALLKAGVNQPGLSCKFERIIRRRIIARFLISLWLIALIILICGYTSTMTSHIVLPMYTAVPTTFQELADSNYKLFVEFWTDNMELDFAAMNKSFSRKIATRIVDSNMIDNECIQMIKEQDHACISYISRFFADQSGHLVDPYGQHQYLLSKETRFRTTAQFGVSRSFPAVFETLDRLISLCLSHGLMDSWVDYILSRNQNYARLKARHLSDSVIAADTSAEQSISSLLTNIFLLGDGVGAVAFGFELCLGHSSRRFFGYQNNVKIFTSVTIKT